ncbi:hypothetical protein WR25_07848 [Diploscapter pachys]|uniref:Uncharacterized protein n=1 Tax=Diploscapter pachys TaxID=2018661 RepID=A0A2A2L1V6_9BILA|nr:hypothetical protein WR25_07848 [Diploscapter pachys]
MQAIVGNDNMTVFACIATSICRAQELYDDCKPIYGDREAITCCCDNTQNCNLNFRGMPTPPPFSQNVSRIRDYPIVCYNGIYLNGTQYIGGGGWQSCEGNS